MESVKETWYKNRWSVFRQTTRCSAQGFQNHPKKQQSFQIQPTPAGTKRNRSFRCASFMTWPFRAHGRLRSVCHHGRLRCPFSFRLICLSTDFISESASDQQRSRLGGIDTRSLAIDSLTLPGRPRHGSIHVADGQAVLAAVPRRHLPLSFYLKVRESGCFGGLAGQTKSRKPMLPSNAQKWGHTVYGSALFHLTILALPQHLGLRTCFRAGAGDGFLQGSAPFLF